VRGQEDALILFSYARDADVQTRYIAIRALMSYLNSEKIGLGSRAEQISFSLDDPNYQRIVEELAAGLKQLSSQERLAPEPQVPDSFLPATGLAEFLLAEKVNGTFEARRASYVIAYLCRDWRQVYNVTPPDRSQHSQAHSRTPRFVWRCSALRNPQD
jgi:hypothetical protein